MHGLILVISAMFIQEPGYQYTEDQVGEALEKIEATMPAAVRNELDTLSQDRAMLEHFRGAAPDVRKSMIEFARKMAYPLPGCAVTQWEWVLFMYRGWRRRCTNMVLSTPAPSYPKMFYCGTGAWRQSNHLRIRRWRSTGDGGRKIKRCSKPVSTTR